MLVQQVDVLPAYTDFLFFVGIFEWLTLSNFANSCGAFCFRSSSVLLAVKSAAFCSLSSYNYPSDIVLKQIEYNWTGPPSLLIGADANSCSSSFSFSSSSSYWRFSATPAPFSFKKECNPPPSFYASLSQRRKTFHHWAARPLRVQTLATLFTFPAILFGLALFWSLLDCNYSWPHSPLLAQSNSRPLLLFSRVLTRFAVQLLEQRFSAHSDSSDIRWCVWRAPKPSI